MHYYQLSNELARNGFHLSEVQTEKLKLYLELLLKWNKVMNLVGPSDWKLILNDLVLDSFYLSSFITGLIKKNTSLTTLDLGAGAGLPGIPLRVVWKTGDYYLVESRGKRAVFMNQAIAAMDIENTFVIRRRAEDIDQTILPAGMIISRAFMPWDDLLPLAGAMLQNKGLLIVLSNRNYSGEDAQGFRMAKSMEYEINNKKRYFWALESNN